MEKVKGLKAKDMPGWISEAILENMKTGIVLLDGDSLCVKWVNEAFKQFLEEPWRSMDLTGVSASDFIPIFTDSGLEEILRQAASTGKAIANQEYEFVGFSRGTTYWDWTLTPLPARDGCRPDLMINVFEITASVLARKQVEMLSSELDASLTAVADGLIIYKPDLSILRINQAAEEFFARDSRSKWLPFSERMAQLKIKSPDGKLLTFEELPPWRALHGETIRNMVLTITGGDGTRKWLSISAAPIPSLDGEIIGAVATLSDITQLHELQQRQEDMIRIVSHDLRIPLTVIQAHMEMLVELLNKHLPGVESSRDTTAINRSLYRMNVMIKELADMDAIEGHRINLKLNKIKLQAYLPNLIEQSRAILPIQRVTLDIPAKLPPVIADDSHLERIMINLLTNAFKYSSADAPVVLKVSRQGDELVVAVTDKGQGISPEDLPHIFERFFRSSSKRVAEGIGLGLYISKLLVELNGGRIWAESELDNGSILFFTLPLAKSAPDRRG